MATKGPALLLFTCSIRITQAEEAVSMPGLSHLGEWVKKAVLWPPFEEWYQTAYFFARNRTQAAKQLERAGINDVRNLSEGKRGCYAGQAIPAALAKAEGR